MVVRTEKKGSKVRSKSATLPSRKVRRATKKVPKSKVRNKLRRRLSSSTIRSRKVDAMVVDGKAVKIGILITYPRLEVKKEELISHRDKNRAWTKLADPKFVVERKFRREKKVTKRHPLGKYAIPTDVAVGCSIKHFYDDNDVEVDMILPHEICKERLAQNDINFLMIYDVLEAFHTDKTKDRRIYKETKLCLETCDNIFPLSSTRS